MIVYTILCKQCCSICHLYLHHLNYYAYKIIKVNKCGKPYIKIISSTSLRFIKNIFHDVCIIRVVSAVIQIFCLFVRLIYFKVQKLPVILYCLQYNILMEILHIVLSIAMYLRQFNVILYCRLSQSLVENTTRIVTVY